MRLKDKITGIDALIRLLVDSHRATFAHGEITVQNLPRELVAEMSAGDGARGFTRIFVRSGAVLAFDYAQIELANAKFVLQAPERPATHAERMALAGGLNGALVPVGANL